MPERGLDYTKQIKTLKELRDFMKSIEDLEDDYEVCIQTCMGITDRDEVGLCQTCDVSYSSKSLSLYIDYRKD